MFSRFRIFFSSLFFFLAYVSYAQNSQKTGVLREAAQVPLALVRLDYARREVCIDQFIRLSGDVKLDYDRMREAFDQVRGYHAAQAAPIVPITSHPKK